MKKSNKEDLAHKFWREYIDSDMLERDKKLDNILKMFEPFISGKIHKSKLTLKQKKFTFTTLLRSYFDDLIEYYGVRK